MSNTRTQIAHTVAESFLPAKQACAQAAGATFATVSVLIEQHGRARFEPEQAIEALSIIDNLREAANSQFVALGHFYASHAKLAPIREQWNIAPNAFGPQDTMKEIMTAVGADLRLVS